jgi:alkyl hydroperoxide reductase subunit AhpF
MEMRCLIETAARIKECYNVKGTNFYQGGRNMQQKRVAVITGGASGIGKETALKFAHKGDAVVIADYDEGKGKEKRLFKRLKKLEAALCLCKRTSQSLKKWKH